MNDNARRWARVTRYAEGTDKYKNPYTTGFGGEQFDPTKGHPNKVFKGTSAAAGAYQYMPDTWYETMEAIGLPRNSPMTKANQDKGFIHMAATRGVDVTKDPMTRENVAKLSTLFASFPTMSGKSYYGQPVKGYTAMEAVFYDSHDDWAAQAQSYLERRYPGTKVEKFVTPTIRQTK